MSALPVQSIREAAADLTVVSKSIAEYIENHSEVSHLFDIVHLLHDLLLRIEDDKDTANGFKQLKASIARICERWWVMQFNGAEYLTVQLVPYLLRVSLDEDAIAADVKRVYRLRTTCNIK